MFIEFVLIGMILIGLIVVFAIKQMMLALGITVAIAIIYFATRIFYIKKKKNKKNNHNCNDCFPDICPIDCLNVSDVCDGDCDPFS